MEPLPICGHAGETRMLSCGHLLCKVCQDVWQHSKCPTCVISDIHETWNPATICHPGKTQLLKCGHSVCGDCADTWAHACPSCVIADMKPDGTVSPAICGHEGDRTWYRCYHSLCTHCASTWGHHMCPFCTIFHQEPRIFI